MGAGANDIRSVRDRSEVAGATEIRLSQEGEEAAEDGEPRTATFTSAKALANFDLVPPDKNSRADI